MTSLLNIGIFTKFIHSSLVSGKTASDIDYVMNPYDLFAIKKLLAVKQQVPCCLTAISMGPSGCISPLQKCFAMGMDEAYLFSDKAFSGSDTYATSMVLSKALEIVGQMDVVVFGEKAVDGETGQVPIEVATWLKWPYITGVFEFIQLNRQEVVVKRYASGKIETIKHATPVLVQCEGLELNEPDISLFALKRARSRQPIQYGVGSLKLQAEQCGQAGSKTRLVRLDKIERGKIFCPIEGSLQKKVQWLHLMFQQGRMEVEPKDLGSLSGTASSNFESNPAAYTESSIHSSGN